MRLLILVLLTGIAVCGRAQQAISIKTKSSHTQAPVAASIFIKEIKKGFVTDSSGNGSFAVPAGTYTLVVTAIGYEEKDTIITLPLSVNTIEIMLEPAEEELEEIIVQSTRTSRTIANVPTRVETIELEEIDEKNNMRPANVAMLLHESTGIQVQQTSATSGNASIRIQGLDGRYTQLLKDGFAAFGGFASGLSVLEIPPLDLAQVEIIKGPASPLFGGGAIAGVVNFISKTPKAAPEYNFILNHSNIGQSNIGGFASGRKEKMGYTMLALYNRQKAYDVDNDHFTEVPKSSEYTLHPKLFLYPNKTTSIIIGNSITKGERTGGDMQVVNKDADATHTYFEKNKTIRNISTFELDKRIDEARRFVAKQSFSVFDRTIQAPAYTFSGVDYNAYTDISYIANKKRHAWVGGANFIYNNFKEKEISNKRNNKQTTGGAYAQHTLDASDKVKVESGFRIDVAHYSNAVYSNTEAFILPRISVLLQYNAQWSSRIGGGMGYKTPTLFTEETETMQYRNIAQLNGVKSEKSYGGTADISFKTAAGNAFAFSLNHMFFYTTIVKPLVLQPDSSSAYYFSNAAKPVRSAGFETNARLIYRDNLKLFLGYTYTDSKASYATGNQFLPLVPRHKLNTALIYEKEDVIKLGLEGYFTGRQYLSNGMQTPAFEELGFMAEKLFEKFSVYINFENFTDTRQSRYKPVANGLHTSPVFDEIWTHTEGFVMNGGIKIKL